MLESMMYDLFSEDHSGKATLRRVEAKLDAIIRHLGIETPRHPRTDEVEALIESGDKIKAIKLLREISGASLADAKRAVDTKEVASVLAWAPANEKK